MAPVETPLIVIVGETASGKTALGIELAQQFNSEIICADSRTIYRGMDIGTAKPTKEERAAVPHHLLDIRNPDEKYSVAQFQKDAQKLITDISSRGKVPIMVGGTGLYVDAVIYNYSFAQDAERDPENLRHVAPKAGPQDKKLRGNTLIFGVQRDKDDLEERIQKRVALMLDEGLVAEARQLVQQYGQDNEVLRGSGYTLFTDGTDLSEAAQQFVRTHVVLAKKQRTWFKRNKSIHWLADPSKAVAITTTYLNNSPK